MGALHDQRVTYFKGLPNIDAESFKKQQLLHKQFKIPFDLKDYFEYIIINNKRISLEDCNNLIKKFKLVTI